MFITHVTIRVWNFVFCFFSTSSLKKPRVSCQFPNSVYLFVESVTRRFVVVKLGVYIRLNVKLDVYMS